MTKLLTATLILEELVINYGQLNSNRGLPNERRR